MDPANGASPQSEGVPDAEAHPIADQFIRNTSKRRQETGNIMEQHHIPRSVANGTIRVVSGQIAFTEPSTKHKIPRTSLEKPLPLPPLEPLFNDMTLEDDDHYQLRGGSSAHERHDSARETGSEGKRNPHLTNNNTVDLTNTTDTEVHTRRAPAVTHETIHQPVHEVREERISREIHHDHVYHRILPIEQVHVLPARHYVLVDDPISSDRVLKEVSANELPGRVSKYDEQAFAESFTKTLPKKTSSSGPRQFTARSFPGTKGDYKEYVGQNGIPQTERWWVHPPELEQGGLRSGQTEPVYFE